MIKRNLASRRKKAYPYNVLEGLLNTKSMDKLSLYQEIGYQYAFENLSEERAQVVKLYFEKFLTVKECSKIMNISEYRVYALINSALRLIYRYYRKYDKAGGIQWVMPDICSLELPAKIRNALIRYGLVSVEDIVEFVSGDEMWYTKIRCIGPKNAVVVLNALRERGFIK